MLDHEKFIRMAMGQAEMGDLPYGCVIVQDGAVIAAGCNTFRTERDACAHAEFNALRAAVRETGSSNLETCTVYSNVEPCAMCMAAMFLYRVRALVFGASMEEIAPFVPVLNITSRDMAARSGHHIEIVSGVLSDLCLVPFRLMR